METTHTERTEPIVCYSYTFARRYPLVIGKIGGWAPLWGPATPTQYGVAVGSAVLLLWTRWFWGFLPGPLNLLIIVGVPFAMAWAVRSARFEHRAPMRALAGLVTLYAAPPKGRVNGRPYTEPRPEPVRGTRIFVAELPQPRGRPAKRDRGAGRQRHSGQDERSPTARVAKRGRRG